MALGNKMEKFGSLRVQHAKRALAALRLKFSASRPYVSVSDETAGEFRMFP